MSLYHKTLMRNLILYSSEITDIIQLILLCHLHVARLFKDTYFSCYHPQCWGNLLESVHVKDMEYAKITDGSKGNML